MKKFFVKALYWVLTVIGCIFLAFFLLIGGLAVYVLGSEIYKKPYETLNAIVIPVTVTVVLAVAVLAWQWAKENYPK
ncbi:MAG TPA: hypothetical protein VF648_00415 [Pyrinomonadaceae bacterium]|jgi:uncharacterized BrkB/YihY/UPF0761 family membrane protein